MKHSSLIILLMVLFVIALAISYDYYLEIQKEKFIDDVFGDYFYENMEEFEELFDDEILELI